SWLERCQIGVYFAAVLFGLLGARLVFPAGVLPQFITPSLALMLFATFLQVPVLQLGRVFMQLRFLCSLMAVYFFLLRLLVLIVQPWLSPDPIVRLCVFYVLLTPCSDYVITIAHVGRADAQLLFAVSPLLLVLQMLLLRIYLSILLGETAVELLHMRPFIEAFIALILIPLLLAALLQYCSRYFMRARLLMYKLDILSVNATAVVFVGRMCCV